jgi:sugar lactone lactonase YvrE
MKRIVALIYAVTLLFGTFSSTVVAQTPDDNTPQDLTYYFRRSWGGEGEQIASPRGVAIANNGDLLIANSRLHRILTISYNEQVVRVFGEYGTEPGFLNWPQAIAVNDQDELFIADTNQRIQKFDRNGTLLTHWGGWGSTDGLFVTPIDIAISAEDVIYVADMANNRIQYFTSDGLFLGKWGTEGPNDGQFMGPRGIAIDPHGCVLAVDRGTGRVQKFSSTGEFISKWSFAEDGDSHDPYDADIAIAPNGTAYIADEVNQVVKSYTEDGTFLSSWLIPNIRAGLLRINTDNAGNLYITHDINNTLTKFSPSGTILAQWGNEEPVPHEFDNVRGIWQSGANEISVSDSWNFRVVTFSQAGVYQHSIVDDPNGLRLGFVYDGVTTTSGYHYVTNTNEILKFDTNWEFMDRWASYGSGPGQFNSIRRITADAAGHIYVSDSGNNIIQKFTGDGNYLDTWGGEGSAPGMFHNQEGIVASSDGFVYIADTGNHRIQKITTGGVFVAEWGGNGVGPGEFNFPSDLAIDSTGNILVTDTRNNRIQVFSDQGVYITQFGTLGNDPGELNHPRSIVVIDDEIFVSDSNNERIQVFTTAPPPEDPKYGLVVNGGFEEELTEWTYGGHNLANLSEDSIEGGWSVLLGRPVNQIPQGMSKDWAYTNFYIDSSWTRPVLTFNYKMHVNDNMHYSDFLVAVQYGVGLSHETTVVRDGYLPCSGNYAPRPGRDLGWRTGRFDLSAYKGQHVRIVFSNRNLWPDSLGIWTNVDNVRVLDAGPIPPAAGSYTVNLPLIGLNKCDIPDYGL